MTDYIGLSWLAVDIGLLVIAVIFYYHYFADKWYYRKVEETNRQLMNEIKELQGPIDDIKAEKDREWKEKANRALDELENKHAKELSEKVAVINNLTSQIKQLEGKNHDLSLQTSSFNSAVDKAKEEFTKAMEKEMNEVYRGVEEFLIDFYDQEYTELEAELTQADEYYNELEEDYERMVNNMQRKIDNLEKEKEDLLADKALVQRELREYKEATAKVIGVIPEKKVKRKISEASLANLKNVNKQNKGEGET
jgi:DNA repair exonuclease SbcCD ATPase subunit